MPGFRETATHFAAAGLYTQPVTPITIRFATLEDADAICTIFNQGIADRVATLDTTERTPDERRHWLMERASRHPVIVAVSAERGDRVVGWASLNRFNARAAYDYVADFSVYVEREHRGAGIGRQLMDRLIELARGHGYHKMVLATLSHNAVGIRLYSRIGFTMVGTYHEQGRIDGRWVDVVIMEKLLV